MRMLSSNGASKLSSQVDFCSKPRMNQKTPRADGVYGRLRRKGSDWWNFPHLDVGHVHGAFPTSATWDRWRWGTDVNDDVG